MNKDNYMKAMDQIKITDDYKERTEQLMKDARNKNNKKDNRLKKFALAAASAAVIVAAGGTALNMAAPQGLFKNSLTQSADITIPKVELASFDSQEIMGRMMPLFVYQGRVYLQSNTVFKTGDGVTPAKEDVYNLQGEFLGITKGSLNEWSSQEDYAKEFASTLGDGGKVYTVKGYDSNHRLMVYFEYGDSYACELYDSFGGLTLTKGADYFKLLNLKDNTASYSWQSFDSWNNGLNETKNGTLDQTFLNFIDSLYKSKPTGEDMDKVIENAEADSQKFLYIITKDNLTTTLRLFKDGSVYDTQAGFFQVDDSAFKALWDSLN